jgi:large subunit ribosomal protein L10
MISARKAFAAASAAELERFVAMFTGPSLLVVSQTDPVSPAKIMADFVKESKDVLSIKGGWIDGACLDSGGVESLAKMPGKQETLAKLLSLLLAPATQFVRLLQAPGRQVVQVLDAQRGKLEEKGA